MTRTYSCSHCGGHGHNIRTCGSFKNEFGATRRNVENLRKMFAAKDRRIEDLTMDLDDANRTIVRLQHQLNEERALGAARDALIDQLWATCEEMRAEIERMKSRV